MVKGGNRGNDIWPRPAVHDGYVTSAHGTLGTNKHATPRFRGVIILSNRRPANKVEVWPQAGVAGAAWIACPWMSILRALRLTAVHLHTPPPPHREMGWRHGWPFFYSIR